ncbi:hypothetical protein DF3PA_80008 [Candidatus Defluviicoccus seviourii]|uniref:Bacteriophage Mu Gp45 N-terminal domain-containing protein n=1 Tax=Candidatus Defluviicoccus seviourii TaxID=2565273 RepID=A0A564WIR3_9PROT|nr:hypothetical protein DF3PA_80008 [Candidatus Defluviicoccus seviourii]
MASSPRARNRARRDQATSAPARAVVHTTDAAGKIQRLQVEAMAGEVMDGAEHLQEYGFASNPLPGAEAVVTFGAGRRNHPIVLAVADRRYRLRAQAAGEVAIYDDQGQYVLLARDGIRVFSAQIVTVTGREIAIDATETVAMTAGQRISLVAPEVSVEAAVRFSANAGIVELVATGLARLAGSIARLHGVLRAIWDAGGTGMSFTPAARAYHYTGTAAAELPPAPEEIP